jgi:hypothetical protein
MLEVLQWTGFTGDENDYDGGLFDRSKGVSSRSSCSPLRAPHKETKHPSFP